MLNKKLVNVANQMEADILIELLKNNGINCLSKTTGSGGFMQITMGMNMFGVDIYVNEEDYGKAKEIADSFLQD